MKSSIFLIGMMGAGKTTVGRVLARRMERPFVDSDHEIEARAGAGIPWIFEKEGEAGFRQREAEMIDELTQRQGIVLATGGGAVIDPRNRRFMAERGIVIYLRAGADQIFQRVSRNRNRPLLQLPDPRRRIEELLIEREAYYSEIADIIIDTGRPRVQHLLKIILEQLRTKVVTRKSLLLDDKLLAGQQLQLDLTGEFVSVVLAERTIRSVSLQTSADEAGLHSSVRSVTLSQHTTQFVQFEVSEMTMNSFTPTASAAMPATPQSQYAGTGNGGHAAFAEPDTFFAPAPVTVNVELGERSYPIAIGADLLRQPETCFSKITGQRTVVITNDVVAPLYLDQVIAALQDSGKQVSSVILPDGESFKTMDSLMLIFDHLLETRCDRKTTLIALGGGVIGDVVGYAAASFMRGVPFLQIPTTLLSQVDSSVGGKTGINHPLGKNMIGAFYQPVAVLADTMTLMTLPERELAAGLAEVIKYGAALDAPFFDWIEKHIDDLNQRDTAALAYAIQRCCEIKADVVRQDERESGLRAMLNFGHTFGHAIESGLGYGHWLHGEAVGCGMVMAADMSKRLGLIDHAVCERVVRLVSAARLPIVAPDLGVQRWIDLMQVDKKNEGGQIRFIVMQGLGGSSMMTVERHVLEETLHALATLSVSQA